MATIIKFLHCGTIASYPEAIPSYYVMGNVNNIEGEYVPLAEHKQSIHEIDRLNANLKTATQMLANTEQDKEVMIQVADKIAELKQQIDLGHQTVNAADEVIAAFQGEVERLKAENETLRELYKGQR